MSVSACGNGHARAEALIKAEVIPRARRSPLEGGVSPRARRSSLEGGRGPSSKAEPARGGPRLGHSDGLRGPPRCGPCLGRVLR
jgi:hypothetical protein